MGPGRQALAVALLGWGLLMAAPAAPPATGPRSLARRPSRSRALKVSTASSRSSIAPAPVAILNPGALAPFFAALARMTPGAGAPKAPVHILQFGDSHTAADGWTGRLRARFQTAYGDAGPGLLLPALPWRGYRRNGVVQSVRPGWPVGSLRGRAPETWVGLPGAALSIPDGERITLTARFTAFRVHVLGEAPTLSLERGVWGDANGGVPGALPSLPPLGASLEETPPELYPRERVRPSGPHTLRILSQDALPEDTYRLAIALSPGSRLLGVDLRRGAGGVLYDELGLNGAELLDLAAWNPELRRELLAEAAPDMVVLAYGTNEAGHPSLDLARYRAEAAAFLKLLRTELPGAGLLVVGPLDRASRHARQSRVLAERVPAVARALRAAALEAGCAFWDARAAMGGNGAIQRWRRQRLAQKDLVHLNAAGYARLGDLLFAALMDARPNAEAPR